MPKNESVSPQPPEYVNRLYAVVTLLTAATYFFSNPKPQSYYDYTFRVATNFLSGRIAFTEKQPTWLNEFVPFEGLYYSVFPLGSVVTMLPFALLKTVGLITEMPAAFISALSAGVICVFLFLIARRYAIEHTRVIVMVLGVLFGTWMWTNLTMAGAWQLALGFAMIGELGAIYFTVYDRRPMIAGMFFALAFGNRTEILLTAPIFFWLLYRSDAVKGRRGDAATKRLVRVNADPSLRVSRVAVSPRREVLRRPVYPWDLDVDLQLRSISFVHRLWICTHPRRT